MTDTRLGVVVVGCGNEKGVVVGRLDGLRLLLCVCVRGCSHRNTLSSLAEILTSSCCHSAYIQLMKLTLLPHNTQQDSWNTTAELTCRQPLLHPKVALPLQHRETQHILAPASVVVFVGQGFGSDSSNRSFMSLC